jgi:hypothetical protein
MRGLLAAGTAAVATAVPVADAHHQGHVPGCSSDPCDKRIGKRWARKHPKARLASVVAPYRAWLNRVGECEDNDNPAAGPTGYQSNTGNGFFGRYQFTLSSWAAVGGRGRPDLAPPLEQDFRAIRLLHLQGPRAWPVCAQ